MASPNGTAKNTDCTYTDNGKGKGKQPAVPPIPPLPNPNAGSANPSASFSALWGYLHPALEHIMRAPTNDPTRAPAVDVAYHMGVHTATYNYFTTQAEAANTGQRTSGSPVSGTDLYEQVDRYFASVAREALLGAPQEDGDVLVQYLVPCFQRYRAGSQSVHRLINYVNRHYVKRAVDEDKGWLRVGDVLFDALLQGTPDSRETVTKRLRERRMEELRKWGYEDTGDTARAEACAEAASDQDRIVPLSSLALRRFRVEVVEPLLAVPKIKGKGKGKAKGKKKPPADGQGSSSTKEGPKGRLARSVKELLEGNGVSDEERKSLAAALADTLKSVGVRPDHPLRKKLDKFVTLNPVPNGA
ncbi:hypothetical protein PLICRDRAFT_286378 [Plicaturopsis crispa FD-325 SS-3]|nr:hypothetical protein PLICRDRAFT_286378 [Plicaturopsis crispa FD-325 SS-3]